MLSLFRSQKVTEDYFESCITHKKMKNNNEEKKVEIFVYFLPVNFISIAESVKRISVDFFNDSRICCPTLRDASNL